VSSGAPKFSAQEPPNC